MHTTTTAIGPRGVLLSAIDNTACRIDGHLPSAFLTPRDVEPLTPSRGVAPAPAGGWWSVWEFLAITEPGTLECSNVAEDWQEQEEVATGIAQREGIEPVAVPAPAVLVAYGISTVRLFPDAILRDTFPARGQ